MKVFESSYKLNSQYSSPSVSEKLLCALDSYFYLGGRRVEILSRDVMTKKFICLVNQGRKVSTLEKVIKIISYLLAPIVIIALLLRSLLRCVVLGRYESYFIEHSIPTEAYLQRSRVLRRKFLKAYRQGVADNSYIDAIKREGINLIGMYESGADNVFTIAASQYPGVTFTFVADRAGLNAKASPERIESLLRHCVQTADVRWWVHNQRASLITPGVIGLSTKHNMLMCRTCLTPDKVKDLTSRVLPQDKTNRGAFQDCANRFFDFAYQTGCSGLTESRESLLFLESQGICLPVIEDISSFKAGFEDPTIKKERLLEAIKKVLFACPPELLKELILKIPGSLKSPEFLHSLIGKKLVEALEIDLDKNVLEDFLDFLSLRTLQLDQNSGKSVIVFQKFGGGDRRIEECSAYGELFIQPESDEGETIPSIGTQILQKMVDLGLISKFENKDREVWIYFN